MTPLSALVSRFKTIASQGGEHYEEPEPEPPEIIPPKLVSSAIWILRGGAMDDATMEDKVFELDGVSRSFGTLKAVDNLTLSLGKGEVTGFFGTDEVGKLHH